VPTESDKSWKSRVSRAEAVQRFLEAAISLIDQKPIPDISVQEIADTAGLNHGYVFRYFGTRIDLLIAVTEELAQRAKAVTLAEAQKREIESSKVARMDLTLIATGQEFRQKRMRVVMYLMSCGVDAKIFGPESRLVSMQMADELQKLGITRRTAEALALRSGVLVFASNFLTEAFGLTLQDIEDGQKISLHEIAQARDIQQALGWDE
jgi:AcrR family transcriptional regulator